MILMTKVIKCCDKCGKECLFKEMEALKQTYHKGMSFGTVCKECYRRYKK